MSRLKRSRALRRNLRKQARKGTLSAREQKTLLQQEKRFRKARRPFMKGLGFGAGLLTPAAALLASRGLIDGLDGFSFRKDDPENEQEDQDEQGGNVIVKDDTGGGEGDGGGTGEVAGTGEVVVNDPPVVGDVVVVGDGEEDEEEEEEAPVVERQPTAEDRARAERTAQRAERSREAGVDAALEAGLGGLDRPYTNYEDPEGMDATRATGSSQVGKLMSALAEQEGPSVNRLLGDLEEVEGVEPAVRYLLGDLNPGRFEELRGALPVAPDRMQTRPAQQLSMDRPDPRVGSTFDPLLEDAGIQRALRGFGRRGGRRSSSFAEGGRVDKSNDLVARIKRKYGLR